jgi:predicted RNA-binding protein with TRAM domain
VILGGDGVPIRYGDEYVYSVADITSGSMPDGSFLLAGYTMIVPTPNGCSPLSDPQAEIRQALRDLTMDGPGCDACGISGTADGSGNTAKVARSRPSLTDSSSSARPSARSSSGPI